MERSGTRAAWLGVSTVWVHELEDVADADGFFALVVS